MKARIFIALAILILSISTANAAAMFHVDKSNDEILNAMIKDKTEKFQVKIFSDDVTGLSINYNLYLPENYSQNKKYPVVFFIADASAAGKAPEFSLTQGYGGLVWTEYDCVVIVPTYPTVILNDKEATEYVELTGRFVNYAVKHYNLDSNRVYATGQSMGCMTLLILASKYPELFTASLFVSGQWKIEELTGLIGQKFIYVTSNGDDKASAGQREVIEMFNKSEIPYVSYQNIDAKNQKFSVQNESTVNFVTFKTKTTLPNGTEEKEKEKYSEHMTSFDYAYRNANFREWLLAQTKGENH